MDVVMARRGTVVSGSDVTVYMIASMTLRAIDGGCSTAYWLSLVSYATRVIRYIVLRSHAVIR